MSETELVGQLLKELGCIKWALFSIAAEFV